ncbi:hypothetical protein FOZ61_005874 [Perkinsus olseni]|uniref:Uncharacterized protein n=1 Tax=Perkinsus olseni TaxID=32597 RepID=A0A7J6LFI8_PEROL|nr:hypothetical protein FOZ61_005874 [Perkinsus olseni]
MLPNSAPSAFLVPTTTTTTVQAHGLLGWISFIILLLIGVGVLYWHNRSDRKTRKSSRLGSHSTARRPTRVSVSRSLRREVERGVPMPIGRPPLPPVMVSGDTWSGLPSGRRPWTYSERKRSTLSAERVAEVTDALLENRLEEFMFLMDMVCGSIPSLSSLRFMDGSGWGPAGSGSSGHQHARRARFVASLQVVKRAGSDASTAVGSSAAAASHSKRLHPIFARKLSQEQTPAVSSKDRSQKKADKGPIGASSGEGIFRSSRLPGKRRALSLLELTGCRRWRTAELREVDSSPNVRPPGIEPGSFGCTLASGRVKEYFLVEDEMGYDGKTSNKLSAFRGRELRGKDLDCGDMHGYVILKKLDEEKTTELFDCVKYVVSGAVIDKVTVWNHDEIPLRSDEAPQCFALARAMDAFGRSAVDTASSEVEEELARVS